MNTQLFIPKKIKVGYQERKDTYTQRLAYIIYYDAKGKLRKETSWLGWIDKGSDGSFYEYDPKKGQYVRGVREEDKRSPLPTHDFDNVPTEGFVLNKKAGDYRSGWSHRQAKCRVYDPRNFEFEISIENLLFILEHATSTKGKGLEGNFIYGWDGKDLVLLPEGCLEYKQSQNYTSLQSQKVGVKDLHPGCIYQTKKQEKLVYLGRFEYYPVEWDRKNGNRKIVTLKKSYFFIEPTTKTITPYNGLATLASKESLEIVDNYAELVDVFQKYNYLTKPKQIVEVKIDLKKIIDKKLNLEKYCWLRQNDQNSYFFRREGTRYIGYNIYKTEKAEYQLSAAFSIHQEKEGFILTYLEYSLDTVIKAELSRKTTFSEERLLEMGLINLDIEVEDGNKFNAIDYFL